MTKIKWTLPTRVLGGSNTAIHHDTRQSSRGISVTKVDFVHVGPASYRQIDDLDKNSFYFVVHFETSLLISHCKSSHKGHEKVTTPNSLKGGTTQQNLFKGVPLSQFCCLCIVIEPLSQSAKLISFIVHVTCMYASCSIS